MFEIDHSSLHVVEHWVHVDFWRKLCCCYIINILFELQLLSPEKIIVEQYSRRPLLVYLSVLRITVSHYPCRRRPLLVYLSVLRITVSHYPFGIFKLFLVMIYLLKTCVYFSCNFRACDCWMQNWMGTSCYYFSTDSRDWVTSSVSS